MRIRGLYAIVDRVVCRGEDLIALAQDYLKGGAKIIQWRDKEAADFETARGIAELKRVYDFTFIVNDHIELARELRADGIHVGKDDPAVAECRKILGPGKIIGYSSHALEEAIEAERQGADYVAFGAVFPTPTKGPGHPVQGLEKLRQVVQSVQVPVVAIGGIGRANIKDVLATGVASVAMISALAKVTHRVEETRYFSGLFI